MSATPDPTVLANPRRRMRVYAAIASLSLVAATGVALSPAGAADTVGTVYNYAPDGTSVLAGDLVSWNGEVLANRTTPGFTAFNVGGTASNSPIATGAPVKFMAVFGPNLLWVDNTGAVKSSNPGGTVTNLGTIPVAIDSMIVVGAQVWFTRPGGIDRYQPSASSLGGNSPLALTTPTAIPRLALGADGNVWAVERNPGGVDVLTRWTTQGAAVGTPYNFTNSGVDPIGIAAGPDGGMWVLLGGTNSIARLDNNLLYSESALPAGATPRALIAGPDGAIWVTENGLNNVSRWTWNAGSFSRSATAAPSAFGLQKLIVGPDANIWAVGTNANRMGKFGTISPTTTTTSTTTTTVVAATLPATTLAPATTAVTVPPTIKAPATRRVCTKTAKKRVKVNGRFVLRSVCTRYKTVAA
jgi:streptogramin lyase